MTGQIKFLKSHTQSQDRTAFRPSYGDLIERFLATESVPTLLMSASCTPKAFSQILSSLKTTEDDIVVLRGELTRPEINFIRVPFPRGSKSWTVLHQFFPVKTAVPDGELPPTLVYCQTQDGTLSALESINVARDNVPDSDNGRSTCVRRYHATTGPQDKQDRATDFSEGKFSTFTCTTALGLGQDWRRVRRVIVVGQSDPTEVLQMAGRAGRDGRPAVAFLVVDQAVAKKKISSKYPSSDKMDVSDDDRMHAMSITPVCLRVAFAVDLQSGYIPLAFDDPAYVSEREREKKVGMQPCMCSNCEPEAAKGFLQSQKILSISNFDEFCQKKSYTSNELAVIPQPVPLQIRPAYKKFVPPAAVHHLLQDFRFIRLVCQLQECLWTVSIYYKSFLEGESLNSVFGSEPLPNAYNSILEKLRAWSASADSVGILRATPEEYALHAKAILEAKNANCMKEKARASKSEKTSTAQKNPGAQTQESSRKNQAKRQISSVQMESSKRIHVSSPSTSLIQSRIPSQASRPGTLHSRGLPENEQADLENPTDNGLDGSAENQSVP
ncbi:hypothetical protein DFH28DRAFT_1117295 [Melampsora americana]|nr:hypothetical protein DFH28DRAFT_1117295 [Melampsora americana]